MLCDCQKSGRKISGLYRTFAFFSARLRRSALQNRSGLFHFYALSGMPACRSQFCQSVLCGSHEKTGTNDGCRHYGNYNRHYDLSGFHGGHAACLFDRYIHRKETRYGESEKNNRRTERNDLFCNSVMCGCGMVFNRLRPIPKRRFVVFDCGVGQIQYRIRKLREAFLVSGQI